MSRTETSHRIRDGARVIAPFAVAVGAFGVTFGVLARDAGLGGLKAVVFSATTFAGSAQFAATSVLSAGGTLAAAIAAAVLLNTRYIPIGLSVAPPCGPAMPVIDTATDEPHTRFAPSAISRAVGSLTAPKSVSVSGLTPSTPVFTSSA